MNSKEFLTELSKRCDMPQKDASNMLHSMLSDITSQLMDENSVVISNFGSFDVKKKLERVIVNAATKQKMLVPPKLVVNFKQANILKNKVNSKS